MAQDFDLAGHQAGFTGAGGRRRTLPVILRTNSLRIDSATWNISDGRVAHDLDEAFAVAQVDEDHAAVVAPAMGPSRRG